MDENKVRARILTLRIRLEQAKEREDYGAAAFISGQVFEQELILEGMLSKRQEGIKKTTEESSNPEHGRSNTIDWLLDER